MALPLRRLLPGVVLVAAAPAFAQTSNVVATEKFAWGENVGYLNFRDAGDPDGSEGVLASQFVLTGFIWGENVGWIRVGDGSPANGVNYANALVSGTLDWGVNRSPTGMLTGYAWGENIGWINFSGGAMATPAQPARINPGNGRFSGYAWGENVGWINLNSVDVANGKSVRVKFGCNGADIATAGNTDPAAGPDGFLTGDDFDMFIAAFFGEIVVDGILLADLATAGGGLIPDGFLTGDDFDAFVQLFFNGC